MREYLFEVLEGGGDLSMQTVFIRLVMAVVIAAFIYLSYRLSHNGSIYSQKFNVSLAVMTIVTATVMIVIGNNIALSLGMVGALSIVRFRTAIKDSRDTVYIFWAIVVGICCGAGDYAVGALGSAFIFRGAAGAGAARQRRPGGQQLPRPALPAGGQPGGLDAGV